MSQEMSVEEAVKEYKQLIRSLPPVNQYLLLYVLDLLSVFAKKAEVNLMNAPSEFERFWADQISLSFSNPAFSPTLRMTCNLENTSYPNRCWSF
jgi:hypothetical protein